MNKADILVINQDYEQIINCKYIKEVDNKANNKNIFVKEIVKQKVKDNVKEIVKEAN
jgi:hypothetical protein